MKHRTRSRRGAILISTVILATAVALAIGTFVALAVQSSRLSDSSFRFNSALNLAEAGLERGLYCVNNDTWTGWTDSGAHDKVIALPSIDLGQGDVGTVKVMAYNVDFISPPRIIAEGTTTSPIGAAVTKQIEIRLSRRSYYATGIVARKSVTFAGNNINVDSYDSSDENHSDGGLYDPTENKDNGTVASVSVLTEDGVDIANGDVWGFVATGGPAPDAGPNGTILGEDSLSGIKIDSTRVATDFTANFDEPEAPTTGWSTITPPPTDIITTTTIYGSNDPAAPRRYQINSITLNNASEVLKIEGHVELVVLNDTVIKGALEIQYDSASPSLTSSLLIWTPGDFDVSGNGLVNESGIPANLEIRGTAASTGTQEIKLAGNAAMQATVYAPNAAITLVGGGSGGEWMGSVVGDTVKITGNYDFHYDESLADKNDGNPFAVGLWRELMSAAEKITF